MTQTLEERIAELNEIAEQVFHTNKAQDESYIARKGLTIINELQQKYDLLEMDFTAAQEIMGGMNKEIRELKKQNKSWKEMVDTTNQTNQALCKRLMDEGINEELIKALNFIRSSDSSTESAAKAIEMLKKYGNIN